MNQSSTRNTIFSHEFPFKITENNKYVDSERVDLINSSSNGQFYISALVTDKNQLDVKIFKTFLQSAIATIYIKVADQAYSIIDISDWKESCEIYNIPIPSYCYKCYYCKKVGPHKEHDLLFTYFKITCKIIWYGFVDEFKLSDINHDVQNYPNRSEFSDVVIKTRDRVFPAHKIILAIQSPVFAKTLTTETKESKENSIFLPNVDGDVVEELMTFMYERKLEKVYHDDAIALKLFKIAGIYKIKKLVNICGLILSKSLTMDNVLMLYETAKKYDSFILKHRAMAFILINRNDIIPSNIFKEFCIKEPGLMYEIIENLNNIY